jgi:hypothetical protein
LVDLVRFLSELGKVGPYSVGKARVVRRWQVLHPTPEARRYVEQARGGSLGGDPGLTWVPAYSSVAGLLPLDAIPRLEPGSTGAVRCQVEATTAGKVKLLVNSTAGLTVWLDQKPLNAKEELVVDLSPGLHTLTVAVDMGTRREGLRCELEDVPGSPARAHLIGGK